MFDDRHRAWTRVRIGAALAAPALLLAACGGTSSSTGGYGSGGTTKAAGSTASAVKVETHKSADGVVLTDASGHSLYLFAADHNGKSACSGSCASVWPPLTTKGTPTATGQATASMLGTVSRTGGTKQVTYAGHPLYYYAGDTAAGQTNGEGINGFGASWWLVSPTGKAVTMAGTSSPSSGGSSGGSGGGMGGGY